MTTVDDRRSPSEASLAFAKLYLEILVLEPQIIYFICGLIMNAKRFAIPLVSFSDPRNLVCVVDTSCPSLCVVFDREHARSPRCAHPANPVPWLPCRPTSATSSTWSAWRVVTYTIVTVSSHSRLLPRSSLQEAREESCRSLDAPDVD